MAGALIEIGFEGGHGTAADMGETFNNLGFTEGTDLALGLATIGILFGVVLGILFLNISIKKGDTGLIIRKTEISPIEMVGIFELDNRISAGK